MYAGVQGVARARVLPMRAHQPVAGIQHFAPRLHLDTLPERRPKRHSVVRQPGDVLVKTGPSFSASCTVLLLNLAIRADGLQGRLRKRLAMALTWYQILDNRAEAMVDASIDSTWSYGDRRRSLLTRVWQVAPYRSAQQT